MNTRNLNKYKLLFEKYDELDNEQKNLYTNLYGYDVLPENKKKFNELQIKKLSILDEMEKCLCTTTTLNQLEVF